LLTPGPEAFARQGSPRPRPASGRALAGGQLGYQSATSAHRAI